MEKIIYVLFVVLSVSACKKDESTPVNLGYHYFPTSEGLFVVYDVTSIIHDDVVAVHDTNVYQIKTRIGETEIDLEGDKFQKLYRFKRDDESANWIMKDVWTMKLTGMTAEVVEENKRILKMGFGISYDKEWDCNALNYLELEECYYAKIAEPFKVDNNVIVDSTAIVEHLNFLTFIDYTRYYEVYAANIGLIYSYKKDFTITNSDTLNPIKGIEQFYSMTDFGIE